MFSRKSVVAVAISALLTALLSPVLLVSPATAAPDCDLGGFEIDGDKPVNCPPGVLDWDNVDFDSTTQGGTYSASSKDVDDPSTWSSAGSTPDKADFKAVYSYAQVGADGHYYLYVAWERTGESGTGKYAIDLSFAGVNVADDGAPQPLHDEGGIVAYINMNGGDDPVLGQLCPYDDQADYPDNVNTDPGDCTTDTTGFASAVGIIDIDGEQGSFFEVGLDLTELADVAPGCPPVTDLATVYMRSITGGNAAGNLKGYVDPLTVTPPSTCGALEVTKESLNDLATDDPTVFEYAVDSADYATTGDLLIDETDSYTEVDPGTDFTLTETIPDGAPWTQYSIICTVGDGDPIVLDDPTDTFAVETATTTSCVITNATSYLDVSKITNPAGAEGDFAFTVNGDPIDSLSDGETSPAMQFAPGTEVTIAETPNAQWTLADIVCTVDGQEVVPTAEDLALGTTTIATVAGETVNCTYTNATSFVTVTKQTLPDGSAVEFPFETTGQDDYTLTDGASETFQYAPGTEVEIAETLAADWDLVDITCSTAGEEVDTSVTVTTVAGQTTECTFTNRQDGRIIVHKSVVGEDDATFTYHGSWLTPDDEFTITTENGTGSHDPFENVTPGEYTLTEDDLEGYDTTMLVCVDSDDSGVLTTVDDLEATIQLDPGETVECTFTNTQRAKLLVDKETLPDEYDQDFDFVFSNGVFQTPFTLNDATDDEANPWTSGFIVAGTYTVTETLVDHWSLTSIDCGERNGATTTIELAPGQVVSCVFQNIAHTGEVSLTKSVTGVDPSYQWSFDFALIEEPDGEPDVQTVDNSALPDSATATWSDLVVGSTYTLIEQDVPDGWDVGEIVCNNGELEDASDDPGFQFEVTPGLVLDCTVVNTASPADVDVTKTVSNVVDGFDWEFDFTIDPVPAEQDATQTASGTGEGSDTVSWNQLVPGTHYTVTEEVIEGWEQGAISCSADDQALVDLNGDDPGFEFVAEVGVSIDCEVTNRAEPGEVSLTKAVEGVDPAYEWSFDFALIEEPDGTPDVQSVDNSALPDSATVTWSDLEVGSTYTLIEQDVPDGWTIGEIVCNAGELEDASDDPGFQFEVTPGLVVECMVTNIAEPGDVTVTKTTSGVSDDFDWAFDFTIDPVPTEQDATQTAEGTGPGDDSVSWSDLVPGAHYTITEEVVDGWEQGDITCSVGDSAVEDLNGDEPGFEFIAGVGVSITCAVTNRAVPVDIDVTKSAVGGDGTFEFALQPLDENGEPVGDAMTASVDTEEGTGVATFENLLPGSRFSLSEVDPGGDWIAGDLSCTVTHADDSEEALDASDFTIQPGDSISCEITNEKKGTIIIHKVVEGLDDAIFDYTGTWLPEPSEFAIETEDGMGTATFEQIAGGEYTVTELPIEGYDTTNLVCVDPDQGTLADEANLFATIDLDPGETVECTFTNTQRVKVLVDKETLPDEFDQDFEFLFAGGEAGVEFTLNDAADDESQPWDSGWLPAGQFTVEEAALEGWALTDIDCGEADLSELRTVVALDPGMVVTCTFTNAKRGPVVLDKVVQDDSVVDHGDGTWSIQYLLTATSSSQIEELYDLSDELQFGGNITVLTSDVVSLDGVTVNDGWNGLDDLVVATDVAIPALGTHEYLVTVTVRVGSSITASQADCTLGSGDSGTGLLNTAELTSWSGTDDAEACAPVKVPPAPPMPVTGVTLGALWAGLLLAGAGGVLMVMRRRRQDQLGA
ncbi:type II secretory pathway pseudopilin PulG [Agromyces cerinus]|uniref:prealbumin-like fold domain-containing protein n=1 Tax=Agromyces cerinus TaxID=33878 RepID=UPI0019584791|nr:hypothetical protein [Agromyces cerinus]MBM7829504.1 type II secretory pathway pseudopilin PulG [Agromyces cerinus]